MDYYESLPSINKIFEACVYLVVAFFIIKTTYDYIIEILKGE